ncbi:MEDS domain-containing protein [Desulfatirhabdium butyrativorans]|uniref:MEDS domain-containing protein n=1 Tax=Desulfatirhabdium butyrativorans TaxID=340467 RepID=UPI000410FCFC|nr:MEDS domain-containing protein [Desulfatirhabdium butyrativorans]
MERLLNIREAATYLHVSEMTIRRWTNDGSLPCYRIGGRKARRFRMSDLEHYLQRTPDTTVPSFDVALGTDGLSVPDGSHLTHLSPDDDESMSVATSYIAEGLIHEETVMMVCPETVRDALIQLLEKRQIDVRRYRDIGRLHVRSGRPSVGDQIEMITDIACNTSGRFRLFGEMSWTLERGWSFDQIRQLESAAQARIRPGALLLCQYPLSQFSAQVAMTAIELHDHLLYRGVLKESPYHRDKAVKETVDAHHVHLTGNESV